MKTNKTPLNNQDKDSHEFDHKPAQSDINMAKIANAKMKKLRDKSFNHQFNKNERLPEVVVNAPKNYSQIKKRDGSQLMTASEAKITDETGFKPKSVKDREFRGGPNRNSRETDSINSVNAFKKMKGDYMSRKFKGNDERLGPITPEQNKAEYDREKHEFYYNTDENKMKMIPTDDGEQRDKAFMGKLENYQLAPERKSALNMLGVSSPLNACWKTGGPGDQGYVQRGMKKKGNRTVPNCVPKASVKK